MAIVAECNHMLRHKSFTSLGGQTGSLQRVGFRVPSSLLDRCMIVRWLPPAYDFKANVDGSSSSSGAGGGGLVRDLCGRIHLAFSHYYGDIINNEAEMRAVWDVLVLCEEHGILMTEVQSDSMQVVLMLQMKINVS